MVLVLPPPDGLGLGLGSVEAGRAEGAILARGLLRCLAH
jgi:hypothetical protein